MFHPVYWWTGFFTIWPGCHFLGNKANLPLVLSLASLIRCYLQFYLKGIHQNAEFSVPKTKQRNQTQKILFVSIFYAKRWRAEGWSQKTCQRLPTELVATTQISHALLLASYQTFFLGFHLLSPRKHNYLLTILQLMRNGMQTIVASDLKRAGPAKLKPGDSRCAMSLRARRSLLDPSCLPNLCWLLCASWHGNCFIAHRFVYLSTTRI